MASSDTPPGRAALAGGGQPQKEGGSDPPSRRRRSDSAAGRENLQKKFNSGAKPPRKGAPDQRVTSEVRSLRRAPRQRNGRGMSAGWQGNRSGIERIDISAVRVAHDTPRFWRQDGVIRRGHDHDQDPSSDHGGR